MVRRLTERERIEILMMIGYGDRARSQVEVCRLFNNKYPNREPITQSTVSKIEQKFLEVGHARDRPRTGRPPVQEDVRLNFLLELQENPHLPTRQVAANNGIVQSSVLKYLKLYKWHPYKVVLVQELNEDDPDRRLQFCETMLQRLNDDDGFLRNIVFSDEATFYLDGTVNRQNCRYWSPENPHWQMEAHSQFPQKLNVWAGIVGNRILGPFFFEGALTGERYLEFLRDELVPALAVLYPNDGDPDLPNNTIWFQQDGAPPHFAVIVRQYLNQVFANQWIGRRGTIEWPPRSPDLTPLDYYLWGYLKSKVYFNRPNTIDELKDRIRNEIRAIQPDTLGKVLQEFQWRMGYCQEAIGGHFEHLF